nr:translation initiation factor IF-2-like [Aegilops tauschii subsp. strangulata]
MLSGFKLPKRKVEYFAVDRPASSSKKKKEDTAAVPPPAEKGRSSARVSPAWPSSQSQEEHQHVESAPRVPLALGVPAPGATDEVPAAPEPAIPQALVMMSPPPAAAPPLPGSSAAVALERALSEMTQLQADLLSADPHLVAGRLELASGWLHSDLAVRAMLGQAAAASEKEKQSAANAAADHETALKDAKAASDHYRALEDELQSLRDQHTEEARCRQAKEEEVKAREDAVKNRDAELAELEKTQVAERSWLEGLVRKAKAREADLDAKARVLAEDRAAFADLEESSRKLASPIQLEEECRLAPRRLVGEHGGTGIVAALDAAASYNASSVCDYAIRHRRARSHDMQAEKEAERMSTR